MKFISIFYKLIFSILAALGFPLPITNLLTSVSLVAIALGIVIVSPEIALIIAIVVLVTFLL